MNLHSFWQRDCFVSSLVSDGLFRKAGGALWQQVTPIAAWTHSVLCSNFNYTTSLCRTLQKQLLVGASPTHPKYANHVIFDNCVFLRYKTWRPRSPKKKSIFYQWRAGYKKKCVTPGKVYRFIFGNLLIPVNWQMGKNEWTWVGNGTYVMELWWYVGAPLGERAKAPSPNCQFVRNFYSVYAWTCSTVVRAFHTLCFFNVLTLFLCAKQVSSSPHGYSQD